MWALDKVSKNGLQVVQEYFVMKKIRKNCDIAYYMSQKRACKFDGSKDPFFLRRNLVTWTWWG